MLLWLLSVTISAAAHAPRQNHVRARAAQASDTSTVARKLNRQTPTVGGSLVHVRKIRASLVTRRARFHRAERSPHVDDDDAIQNDAPAAHFDVDPCLALRQLGVFVEAFEPQPFTHPCSPRPPRGPPAAA